MLKRTLLLAALVGTAACLGTSRAAAADEDRSSGLTDQQFVTQASAAGLAEVNLGRMALQQSSSADVKKFAQHMIDDHTKANQELNAVADKSRLRPAPAMDQKHEMLAQRLSQLRGADFDRAYADAMVKDHEEAVSLFERESKDGQSKELKDFASKTLPTLKDHLEMARKLTGHEGQGDKGATSTDREGSKTRSSDTDRSKDRSKDTDKDKDKDRGTDKDR